MILLIILSQSCNTDRKKDNNTINESKIDSEISETSIPKFQSLLQQYEDPDRQDWQNPDLVIEEIGDLKGKAIADIGAGSGYFTFRLAEQAKSVIAIDIDERFLDYLIEKKKNFPDSIRRRVETRLTEPQDPSLKVEEVDIILMVNTYRFLEGRLEYLKKLKESLMPEGVLMIVDIKGTEVPIGHSKDLFVSSEQIQDELETAGFKIQYINSDSLPYQFIIKANKNVD
ncbi:MAG: methyltransferase [Bacteroidota bacterium]